MTFRADELNHDNNIVNKFIPFNNDVDSAN